MSHPRLAGGEARLEIWSNQANQLRIGVDLRAMADALDRLGEGTGADEFLRGLWSTLVEAAGPEAREAWGSTAPTSIDDELGRPEASHVYNLAARANGLEQTRLLELFQRIASAVERDPTRPGRPDLLAVEVHRESSDDESSEASDVGSTGEVVNVKVALRPPLPLGDGTRPLTERIAAGEVLLKAIYRGRQQVPDAQRKVYLSETIPADKPAADLLQDFQWAPFLADVAEPRLARQAMRRAEPDRTAALQWTGQTRGDRRRPDRRDVEAKIDLRTGSRRPPGPRQDDISDNTYLYTRKTAVSLVPKNGRIQPYNEDSFRPTTGLLFDIHRSDLKGGRYLFDADIASYKEQWLQLGPDVNPVPPTPRSLGELQNQTLNSPTSERYNELLVGVQKEGVIGVFYNANRQEPPPAQQDRALLQGIARTRIVTERLGLLRLPLIHVGLDRDPNEVTRDEQLQFLSDLLGDEGRLTELARARLTTLLGTDKAAVADNRDGYRAQITDLQGWLEGQT